MPSLSDLPEITTDLFINGEVHTTDDSLQVIDPADGVSVVGYAPPPAPSRPSRPSPPRTARS
ncbi:hypothetical protein A7K94_0211325, partial [Modestobacter sp. VKM Ac-2676]